MTHTALVEVLERASVDPTFPGTHRERFRRRHWRATRSLTEERLAIIRGDSAPRGALGVDSRVTKLSDTPTLPQGDDPISF